MVGQVPRLSVAVRGRVERSEKENPVLRCLMELARRKLTGLLIIATSPSVGEGEEAAKQWIEEAIVGKITSKKAQNLLFEVAKGEKKTSQLKEVVAVLKKHWVDVNATNIWGQTALHLAAIQGNVDAVRVLIGNGADVNYQCFSGETALFFAAQYGYGEILELLIGNGADVNAQDKFRKTALHMAVKEPHTDIVSALIAAGADVSAQGIFLWTALYLAAEKGHADVVNFLVIIDFLEKGTTNLENLTQLPKGIPYPNEVNLDTVKCFYNENDKDIDSLMEKRRKAQARLLVDQKVRDQECNSQGVTPVLKPYISEILDELKKSIYEETGLGNLGLRYLTLAKLKGFHGEKLYKDKTNGKDYISFGHYVGELTQDLDFEREYTSIDLEKRNSLLDSQFVLFELIPLFGKKK